MQKNLCYTRNDHLKAIHSIAWRLSSICGTVFTIIWGLNHREYVSNIHLHVNQIEGTLVWVKRVVIFRLVNVNIKCIEILICQAYSARQHRVMFQTHHPIITPRWLVWIYIVLPHGEEISKSAKGSYSSWPPRPSISQHSVRKDWNM